MVATSTPHPRPFAYHRIPSQGVANRVIDRLLQIRGAGVGSSQAMLDVVSRLETLLAWFMGRVDPIVWERTLSNSLAVCVTTARPWDSPHSAGALTARPLALVV